MWGTDLLFRLEKCPKVPPLNAHLMLWCRLCSRWGWSIKIDPPASHFCKYCADYRSCSWCMSWPYGTFLHYWSKVSKISKRSTLALFFHIKKLGITPSKLPEFKAFFWIVNSQFYLFICFLLKFFLHIQVWNYGRSGQDSEAEDGLAETAVLGFVFFCSALTESQMRSTVVLCIIFIDIFLRLQRTLMRKAPINEVELNHEKTPL